MAPVAAMLSAYAMHNYRRKGETSMKRKNLSTLSVGIILIGLLIVRCTEPLVPKINILSPDPSVPVVSAIDPLDLIDPILVDVEVAFPPTIDECAGLVYPVYPGTLSVTLQEMDDWEVLQEWEIDASGWWNDTNDGIQGQITIGGVGSEQSWSTYRLTVSIKNAQGPVKRWVDLRVERPIADFPGGIYTVAVSSITQQPASCVLPQAGLDAVMGILGGQTFTVVLPDADAFPADVTFPLPEPVGTIVVHGTVDGGTNDIVFDPLTLDGIDLGPYNLPGFNCLVGGSADGAIDGQVRLDDLDGTIRVFDMSVGTGTGTGDCILNSPPPDCNLFIRFDGDAPF
jgi:hypothetical protein